MKDRVLRFLGDKGLTATRFADIIGVQRSSISHILSGRNKPSFDFIQRFLRKFPEVNAEWLILGKGNMYSHLDDSKEVEQEEQNASFNKGLFADTGKQSRPTRDVVESEPPPTYNTTSSKRENILKKIERIVIFYEDHSFSEYTSSE
jgi:transcriptional regulator with XRE-family HTH domain